MQIAVMPVLAATAALLSVGALLLGLFSVLPATARHARPLWPTLGTELAIVAVVGLSFLAGGPVLLVALLAMALRVGYESASVAMARLPFRPAVSGKTAAAGIGAAIALVGLLATLLPLRDAAGMAVMAAAILAAILYLRRHEARTLANALAEILLFPGLPMAVFIAAAVDPAYSGLLLALFLLVETYDSYALLGGKLFGRHPAFPRLSPRKTIEGLAAGAFGLAVTAAIVGAWLFDASIPACVALAILVGILSTAGDLAASRLKRIAGVKDYPTIMPRQGGLFDIVDAWLMTGGVIAAGLALA